MRYIVFLAILLFLSSCKGDLDLIVPSSAPGIGSPSDVPLIYEVALIALLTNVLKIQVSP